MQSQCAILKNKHMKIRPVSEWTFYKYRFLVGYGFLAIVVALYILLFANLIPPGLSQAEQDSVVASAQLSFTQVPTAIVDLPYHILQKVSLEFLGVSTLGIRLPSMIFGILTAVFTALVLRRWMPSNVALISSLLMLTSGWFIGTARLGVPFIMIAFFSSFILLAATYISQQTHHWKRWKVALAFAAALSLYSPFTLYLFVAAIVAAVAQPHLRYLIRQSSKFHITIGTFLFILVLLPLGWGIFNNPSQIWTLLAIPQDLPSPLEFGNNLIQALSNFANPRNVSYGNFATPLISVVALIFFVAGSIRILRDFHAVRTYLLMIWGALLIPIMGFNPNNLTVLMIPTFIIIAIGIQPIIGYWYKLFPLNPYARVFGLVPLTLLILAIIQFNDQRYSLGMIYSQGAKDTYNSDVFLANKELGSLDKNTSVFLIVADSNIALYQILAEERPNTTVLSATQAQLAPGRWIVANAEVEKIPALPAAIPTSLIANDDATDALRFRVFDR